MAPLKRFAPGRAATRLRTAAEDAACVANLDRRDVSASLVSLHENTKLLQRFAQVEPLPEDKEIATAVVDAWMTSDDGIHRRNALEDSIEIFL